MLYSCASERGEVMKVGLVDVDSHNFPNVALMKISAWHKAKGDDVEWIFPMYHYDRVYMSKVFDFTDDFNTLISANEIYKGGTGYDLNNKLDGEIETIYPDYSLYGIKNTAYGFLTRGCPRACDFCIVSKKEGRCSQKVADLKQFWNGQKEIKLLDPNLLACKDKMELLDQLIESKAWIDFTQGLDIRLMDYYIAEKFKQLKIKMIHFAWDKMRDSEQILKNLHIFKVQTEIDYRQAKVYVLTNFDTTLDEDLYRVYKLKELGYDPYIMIYDKQHAPKQIRRLQRWVNNKIIFRTCANFEDYMKIS
jgi:hypothetical protein